jgi:hypothetical protein
MTLEPDEIEEAARRLAKNSLGKDWDTLDANEREGFRLVVVGLAGKLKAERTPEAVHVFLTWMGEAP